MAKLSFEMDGDILKISITRNGWRTYTKIPFSLISKLVGSPPEEFSDIIADYWNIPIEEGHKTVAPYTFVSWVDFDPIVEFLDHKTSASFFTIGLEDGIPTATLCFSSGELDASEQIRGSFDLTKVPGRFTFFYERGPFAFNRFEFIHPKLENVDLQMICWGVNLTDCCVRGPPIRDYAESLSYYRKSMIFELLAFFVPRHGSL